MPDHSHAFVHFKDPWLSGGYLNVDDLFRREVLHHHGEASQAVAVGCYQTDVVAPHSGNDDLFPAAAYTGYGVLKRFSERQFVGGKS